MVLDGFLRGIWLECCDHLSQFIINGVSYVSLTDEDWEPFSPDELLEDELGDQPMSIPLGTVLWEGANFTHEYDFGSTTEINLKVHSVFFAQFDPDEVVLLARNNPPEILCQRCGKPARWVCPFCIWSGEEAWLCKKCVRKHKCEEDYFLPVVNSPRVGVCGYTGEADIETDEELW